MEQEPAQHQQSSLLSSYEWWRGNFLRTLNRTKSWRRVVGCCDRTSAHKDLASVEPQPKGSWAGSGQWNRRRWWLWLCQTKVVVTVIGGPERLCERFMHRGSAQHFGQSEDELQQFSYSTTASGDARGRIPKSERGELEFTSLSEIKNSKWYSPAEEEVAKEIKIEF